MVNIVSIPATVMKIPNSIPAKFKKILSSALGRSQVSLIGDPKFLNLIQAFTDSNLTGRPTIIFKQSGRYLVYMANNSIELNIRIEAELTDILVLAAYSADGKDKFKFHFQTDICQANNRAKILVKGVFSGQSRFDFLALTKISPQAKQIEAYQTNKNLVMSDDVMIKTRPFLEIKNGDLSCGHSSATSSLADQDLNYLLSRRVGISQAEQLLANGFLKEIETELASFILKED